jgi:3-deoxy-7-phosphoheptulonate synthase
MIVVMEKDADEMQIDQVIARLVERGFDVHRSTGVERTVLGAMGEKVVDVRDFELMDGVQEVVRVTQPYRLCSRAFKPEGSLVRIKDVAFGGPEIPVIGGPGAIESAAQLFEIAGIVKRSGGKVLRGGVLGSDAYPSSYPGMGEEGLKLLRQAADRHGLLAVSEVRDLTQVPMFRDYVDILQVGARNMQNTLLLKAVGKSGRPVLLKRGIAARVDELLVAADCILREGNSDIILCERGVRSFEGYSGVTLDISAIPAVKRLSHLPIIVDPSQSSGRRDRVAPLARAALAAGADGLMIEVHNDPAAALIDGAQSLYPEQFGKLMEELRVIAQAVQRYVAAVE